MSRLFSIFYYWHCFSKRKDRIADKWKEIQSNSKHTFPKSFCYLSAEHELNDQTDKTKKHDCQIISCQFCKRICHSKDTAKKYHNEIEPEKFWCPSFFIEDILVINRNDALPSLSSKLLKDLPISRDIIDKKNKIRNT